MPNDGQNLAVDEEDSVDELNEYKTTGDNQNNHINFSNPIMHQKYKQVNTPEYVTSLFCNFEIS